MLQGGHMSSEASMYGRFDMNPRPQWKTAVLCFRGLEGSRQLEAVGHPLAEQWSIPWGVVGNGLQPTGLITTRTQGWSRHRGYLASPRAQQTRQLAELTVGQRRGDYRDSLQ